MPESKLREIADAADMIVSGFAFNKNGEMIRIVNLNEGEKYGMPPEEISKFCKWYTDLMAENMEFNGEPFILRKEDENKQGE